nr:helicase [Tanacetum cinerariifolium]
FSNDPVVKPSMSMMLHKSLLIASKIIVSRDGIVHSYYGLKLSHIPTTSSEFQKHGIPYAHILLWLEERFKCMKPDEINDIISAELPSLAEDPDGYKVVSEFMLHAPCDKDAKYAPCTTEGKCSKHYPKVFLAKTLNYHLPNQNAVTLHDSENLSALLEREGLSNDIYSLIDSNKTAKYLWDAFARHMLGSEYGEQDRKAAVLYEYETFKATEGELLLDTYIRYLQKPIVVTSDPLALIAEKTKVSKSKEKVVVSSDSEGSSSDDFSELKKITALLAKAFNRRKFYSKPTNNNLRTSSSSQSANKKQEKFYSKPTNNNLRTSSTSQSANKKQEFVKSDNKKVEKKDDEKKQDMRKVKCYNCKKEGHFAKDCKKAKVKDYNYYKTKMLLAKKDSDEQVLLAEDQA